MKKLLGILVLGLMLQGCATTDYIDSSSYEEFIKKAKGLGYIYFAKAQNPGSVTAEGSGLYSPAGSNSSQDHANTSALQVCGSGCVITMEGSKITPEGERLIKEAKLVEQKKISDKKVEIASMVDNAKSTCKELGFKEGTEKFADCSLKLYSQKVELAAEKNQTVVMQPQSSGSNTVTIYDPVRDSNALIRQGQRMISGACTLGINC